MRPPRLKNRTRLGAKDPGRPLRTLASGGESLSEDMIEWGRSALRVTINEFYGQTECKPRGRQRRRVASGGPGWTGRRSRTIVGSSTKNGREAAGTVKPGSIVPPPRSSVFPRYWRNDAAKLTRSAADWLVSGDLGPATRGYSLHRSATTTGSRAADTGSVQRDRGCMQRHRGRARGGGRRAFDPSLQRWSRTWS